jgi:hypothetical protein
MYINWMKLFLKNIQIWTPNIQGLDTQHSRLGSDHMNTFWGYVAICVQLYCRWFTVLRLVVAVLYTTRFGLHGHLNVKQWTIYNKAALRRQHNLKTYWTLQCSRMLKYSISDHVRNKITVLIMGHKFFILCIVKMNIWFCKTQRLIKWKGP